MSLGMGMASILLVTYNAMMRIMSKIVSHNTLFCDSVLLPFFFALPKKLISPYPPHPPYLILFFFPTFIFHQFV